MTRLLEKREEYIIDYPKAIEYADLQNSVFWTHDEIDLEKDLQDLRVNLTPSEYHGVITVLKLFTKYELSVGNEYWGGVVKKIFNRPDIQRMADSFTFFETNVHAPFYNKINQILHLDTVEFYNSYKNNEVLVDRMNFIDSCLNIDYDSFTQFQLARSLGTFALIEGAVLYSSFAFLKHFQSNGKNKLKNLVTGIDFSVRDENIHHEAGAWLFRTLVDEELLGKMDGLQELQCYLLSVGSGIIEHESKIIDMIFERGDIEGITKESMKEFVAHRVNLCLSNLKMGGVYGIEDPESENKIKDWFYKSVGTNAVLNDNFNGINNQYNRNWNESAFSWRQ